MILFSQRHKKAIWEDKKIQISISKKIRHKIIFCMRKHNSWYGYDDQNSIFYDDLQNRLIESYGETSLKAWGKDALNNEVYQETQKIEEFITGTRPELVLDAIEMYYTLIEQMGERTKFGREINEIFRSENFAYRILDGNVVKLDSDFLESEILNKAYELLKDNNFEKACKDFLSARNNLTAGDYSGTITEANNAIESALKKALNKEKGEQGDLKKLLMKSGMIPDYFQGFCDHFEGLLQSAFAIANKSSRHGKKEIPKKKDEIDYPVASFFLHLTGSLLVFIMERYQESVSEEEIPF